MGHLLRWTPAAIRRFALFLLGMAGFVHELLAEGERKYMVWACLVLMGLPVILNADARRDE